MYNVFTKKSYGAVRVSTGILRYDKRGGLDNPVIMSTLKLNDNKTGAMAADLTRRKALQLAVL